MSQFIVTDELFKARCSATPPRPKTLSKLCAAKDDTAVFQVLCDSEGKRCILNPGVSPAMTYEIGLIRYRVQVVSEFSATVYAEGYLPDENGILCADILYESPQAYDGGRFAPAYVMLHVPANAKAGAYPVLVRVYEAAGAHDEALVASLQVKLHVVEYVMPGPRALRCYLDLWQHNSNIARTYGVEPWSEAHFAKLEQVVASLAELGQKSVTVLASDCPWRGWGCYLLKDHPATLYEYTMAAIVRKTDGSFTYDFTAMRRYIELCFSYGIRGDITVYGLLGIWTNMPLFPAAPSEDHPEKVLVRYYDEADGCYRYMKRSEDIRHYFTALFAFFKDLGVFDLVRVGADEPADLASYEASRSLLLEIAPDVRFKMALDKTDAIERFGGRTADIAASFPCSCVCGKMLRGLKRQDTNKRLLWYVCNIPDRPNTVLHSELAELRALGPIGYLFGFDGFLRWAYTCWTAEPLQDVRYNNTALPAGDVNFVYPGKDGSLLYSIRYFALKKAIQDHELLTRLEETCGKDIALSAVRIVLKNIDPETYMKTDTATCEGIYSTDYADYDAFRNTVFRHLIEEE